MSAERANVLIELGPEQTVIVKVLSYLGYPKFDEYRRALGDAGCTYDANLAAHRAKRSKAVAIYDSLRNYGFVVEVDVRLKEVMAVQRAKDEAKEDGADAHLVRIKIDLAKRDLKLYPYQETAVRWLFPRDRALLGDQMGCIDGSAEIQINRGGKGMRVKLRDAFLRSRGEDPRPGNNWDPKIPTRIRALCDGELRLNPVQRFLSKGRKPVLRITLASGKSIRVTPDHEIAVNVRGALVWRRADALRIGTHVFTNGQPVCTTCGSDDRVSTSPSAKFPGLCRRCMYTLRGARAPKHPRYVDKDGYVRLRGKKWWSHPRYTTGGVYEHIVIAERMIGRSLNADERVHHKNGMRSDNRTANLEVLTETEHMRHHGLDGGHLRLDGSRSGRVRFIPLKDKVVSVRKDGVTDVYDIVCADPHRNFVANGIVVHNCGKTPELLCALPGLARAMICVPASLKFMWRNEINLFRPDLTPVVLNGKASFRWPEPGEALIFNYELLPAIRSRGRRLEIDPDEWPDLMDAMPDRIHLLADEAHFLKNGKSKRAQKFRTLSQEVRNRDGAVWLATGTPIMRAPNDLWHVLRAGGMELDAFRSWPNFQKLFKAEKGDYGMQYGDPDPMVPELLKRVMLRRLRVDVLPEIPPKTYHKIPVQGIDRETKRACDEVLEALEAAGIELTWSTLNTDLREDTLIFHKMAAARAALAAAKIKHMKEIVSNFEEEQEPLVVFSSHRSPIDFLGERPGWAKIVGGVDPEERTRIVKEFQAGRLKGIACTIGAGGVGLTLTRANHLLFVQLDFNPANNEQCEDRICRIGQEADKVVIHHMIADHELDQRITEILLAKQRMIEASIKPTHDAEGNEVDHL